MATRDRILEAFPPIYAIDEGSVLRDFVDAIALELDAYAEDLDRLRRTHWFELAYRLVDLEQLAALVGVTRRSWEPLDEFRQRVRALVDARLAGAVGPRAVRGYVYQAIRGAEVGLDGTLVPGLRARAQAGPGDPLGVRGTPAALRAAFAEDPGTAYRPLELVENPARTARSGPLSARAGLTPYLYRWEDVNHGLRAAPVTVTVTGRSGGRTATPLIANLSTGQAIGYSGVLKTGQRLELAPAPGETRLARATLDDVTDVTDRVFSLSGFALGTPFALADADDPGPLLPLQERGGNDWIYLSAGLFDARGLDATYFQLADDSLREGAFDGTRFDEALFASPIAAHLELRWTEHEPAAFTVVVPHGLVVLPAAGSTDVMGELVQSLDDDLAQLRAVGVHSRLELRPFTETQPQRSRVSLPWVLVPAETGPAGQAARLGVGGRFSDSTFGGSRFE
jgi:hypothetical protein